RRLLARVRVIERAKSRPVDGAKAHRARLATRIDFAIRQMKSAELRTGAADGDDFGVGGGVAARGDLVAAFRHDDAVTHDHGSKWPTLVGGHAFQREIEGALHEIFIGHRGLAINNGSSARRVGNVPDKNRASYYGVRGALPTQSKVAARPRGQNRR